MSQHEIEQIEVSISELQKMVEMGKRAERLALNPDFKALIMDGYFGEEASRLALLMSDPRVIDQGQQEFVRNDLMAIGGLKRYLSNKVTFGQNAADEIESHQYTLGELREEELDSGEVDE